MTIHDEHAPSTPAIEDVTGIIEAVWESFLGGPPEIRVLDHSPPHGTDQDLVSASILVHGAWEGGVVVTCVPPVAERVAAAMLRNSGHVDDSDVGDAMGELANVLGGNVKSLVPQPSSISLPVVSYDGLGSPTPAGAQDVCVLDIVWQGSPISLRIWTRH